ncbi:MAG: hypothetical protein M1820_009911 [Bogoriella megaspora]|nr:MAG: hypothetical protein M1820_009911 [Bogoriella megaspora]
MKIAVILICSFFGSLGNAQNLTQVFTLYPELSSLSSIIANSSSLFKQLEAANDYTFLAPSNDAIAARVKSPSSNASIDTVLAYHLFHRILPLTRETLPSNGTFDDTETSFLISSLTDSKYALVSGGQRAKFMFNDEALIQSGNRTTSQITIANIMWKGGITHIIDTVLEFPMDALIQATTARLSYFAGIFNSGGLLNASNAGPVMRIGTMPDATYFFPDSESTLTSFKQNSLEPSMLLEYHAVQGLYYSTNFTNGTTLNTTAGVPLLVTLDENGDIYLNTAKITTPDYLIFNGVMHVIDR